MAQDVKPDLSKDAPKPTFSGFGQQGEPKRTAALAFSRLLSQRGRLEEPGVAEKYRSGKEVLLPYRYHSEHGPEVSDFLYRLEYADALKRLKAGSLHEGEAAYIQDVRAVIDGQDMKAAIEARRQLEFPTGPTGNDVAIGPAMMGAVSDELILGRHYGVESPIQDGANVIAERGFFAGMFGGDVDIEVSDNLRALEIDDDERARLETKMWIAEAPIEDDIEIEGRGRVRAVNTPDGYVEIPTLSSSEETMAVLANRGYLTGGPREPFQFVFHKAAEAVGLQDQGIDFNVKDAFGNVWPYVPVITGNNQRDLELLKDPAWARALGEARIGGLAEAALTAGQMTYFVSSFTPVVGAPGAALKGVRAAKTAAGMSRAAGAGRFSLFTRYMKAWKQAYVGEKTAVKALPGITGTLKAPAHFAYYDGFSAFLTGSDDPLTAAGHGFRMGVIALAMGQSARVAARMGATGARGMVALTNGKPRFAWRLLNPKGEAGDFASRMQVKADAVAIQTARAAKSEFMAETLSQMWSGASVGLGLGALGAAEAEKGGDLNFADLGDLKLWLSKMDSPTAIGTALALGNWSAMNGGAAYTSRTRGLTPTQSKLVEDVAEQARAGMKNLPEEVQREGLKTYQDMRDKGTMADFVREIRDSTGRTEPTLEDPLPESYGLKDLIRWGSEGAKGLETMADALEVMSSDSLTRLVRESRELDSDASKAKAGTLRTYAQEILEDRAANPKMEEDATRRRAEMQVDKFAPAESMAGKPEYMAEGELARLGFRHQAHVLNALKKYLGRTYKTLEEVPEKDFRAMVEAREAVKAEGEEATSVPEVVGRTEKSTRARARSMDEAAKKAVEEAPEAPERPAPPAEAPKTARPGELPMRIAADDYRDALANLESAGRSASRVRVQDADGNWKDLLRMDEPLDGPHNGRVMRQLMKEDLHLQDQYKASLDPFGRPTFEDIEIAELVFEADARRVKAAVRWTEETLVSLATERGRGTEARDVLSAVRLKGEGQPIPQDMIARLQGAGWVDDTSGKPMLKEGAQKRLAMWFLDEFEGRVGEKMPGEMLMFAGVSDPLNMLGGFGLMSSPIGAEERSWWAKKVVKKRPRAWLDALKERYVKNEPRRTDPAWDFFLEGVYRNLIKPIWVDFFGLPETTPFVSSKASQKHREYRRMHQDVEGVANDLLTRMGAVVEQMLEGGMTAEDARLVTQLIDAKAPQRFRSSQEFAKEMKRFGIDSVRSNLLWNSMRRYVAVSDETAVWSWRHGIFNEAQIKKWMGGYVANFRPNTGDAMLQAALQEKGQLAGATGREMERAYDPTAEGVRSLYDIRAIAPIQQVQESNRIRLVGTLAGVAAGRGSISEAEYRSYPKSEQTLWERAAVPRTELGEFNSELHRAHFPDESRPEFQKRIRQLRTRGVMLGDLMERMRKAVADGVAPETERKSMMIEELSRRYVTSNVAREMEMLQISLDPSYANQTGGWLQDLIFWWRRAKTARNPTHLTLNFHNSFQSNWQTGKVGIDQAIRGLVTGEGPYGDAARDIPNWYDFKFAKGEFEGHAPGDFEALKGHAQEDSIRRFDAYFRDAGGSTFGHLFLDAITARDMLSSMAEPVKEVPEFQTAMEEYNWALGEATKRIAPSTSTLDHFILRATGSNDPKTQAAGLRASDAYYQLVEHFFKYAGTLGQLRTSPGASLREATESALSGTADYGARNPHFYGWMTMMQMYRTEAQKSAADAVKQTRQKAQTRGPRSLEELRNIVEARSPEGVRTAAKFATARQFVVYPHVMIPTLLRNSYSTVGGALRTGVVLATSELLIRGISEMYGSDDEELLEALAGTYDFPDEWANAVPSEDAIAEYINEWGAEPPSWLSFFGHDASGSLMKEWASRPKFYKELAKDLMLNARQRSIARMPSRGAEETYSDFGESLRPLSTVAGAAHSWKMMKGDRVPWSNHSGFFDEYGGWLAAGLMDMTRGAIGVMGGQQGKSGADSWARIVKGAGREFAPMIHPTLWFMNPKGSRIIEEALMGGQRWDEALVTGIEDPSIVNQNAGERWLGAVSQLALSARKVPSWSRETRMRGGIGKRILDSFDLKPGKGESVDELSAELEVLHDRTRKQMERIVVDAYQQWKDDEIDSIDAHLMSHLSIDPWMEEGKIKDDAPGQMAKFARAQMERGHSQERVIATILDAQAETAFDVAWRSITDLMYRRDVPASTVARLWKASNKDQSQGLLDEIHHQLITEKRHDLAAEMWYVYDRTFSKTETERRATVKAERLQALDTYFKAIDARTRYADYAWQTPALKALGPQAYDLAPSLARQELPKRTAKKARRMQALEDAIKNQ